MLDKLIDLLIGLWEDMKPIYFVKPYQNAVQYRAGSFLRSVRVGWWFKIPFIDEFHTENVATDTINVEPVSITTLDEKTISIPGYYPVAECFCTGNKSIYRCQCYSTNFKWQL